MGIQVWLDQLELLWIANGLQALLHLMLFVPLVMLTALVLTALFAMPTLIRVVAERDYPQLKRENGGGFVGSVWNAVIAIVVFVALWLLTLPMWLIGVGVLIPFVAAAYLNQRLFRYDALAEHATAGEMATLLKSERSGWWGLGLLTGVPGSGLNAVRLTVRPEPFDKLRRALSKGSGRMEFFLNEQYWDLRACYSNSQ